MAQQIINVGTAGDDGTGDTIRRAGIRINDNFTEVYAFDNVASDLSFDGNTIKTKSSNNNIELRPSGTGSVNFPGLNIRQNNIEAYNSNDDIRITPSGTGNLVFPGITFRDNVIEATRSNDDIVLRSAGDGVLSDGVIKLADGILLRGNDIEGVRSNDDINLRTSGTGAITFNDAIRVRQNQIEAIRSNDDLHISPAGSGAIFFGEGIKISGNDITTIRSNDNLGIIPAGSGNVVIDGLSFAGTTITATDSSNININDGLIVDGNLTSAGASTFDSDVSMESTLGVTGLATLSTLQVSGASSFVGTTTVDNLTFNDNIIGTSSNADLRLTPGGTGVVNVSNITIDAALNLTDNIIKVTRSNDSLLVNASGTGSVVMSKADVDSGNIDDTVVGATTPAAATFSSLTFSPTSSGSLATTGVTVTDNAITSNRSNENLEFTGNGTGTVTVNGFVLPSSDGSTGQVLRTDGSKTLSFITSPILLGASDIQDIEGQIGFSATTAIDHVTATGTHEQIGTDTVLMDNFDLTKYRSAFYFLVKRQDDEDEFEASKLSVLHGKSDDSSVEAFITESHVLAHTSVSHVQPTVDIDQGELRLFGSGSNPTNSTIFYRIGLGDDDSSGYVSQDASQATTILNADVSSGPNETKIDHVIAEGTTQGILAAERTGAEFTASEFNGALYHIITKDVAHNSFETQKVSVLHNFNDAFLTSSSVTRTDVGDTHPTFDADMVTSGDSTSKIRLRMTDSDGSSVTPSNTMAYYRIGIGDSDSTGYAGEIGLVHDIMHVDIIDSSVVTLDAIAHGSHVGAKYFINVKNQSTGECSNIEALVTHDGTDAYITTYNEHFSGNNSLINLTADINGSSFRLRGSATSGASTKVIVNRIVAFGDSESDEEVSDSTRKVIGNTSVSSTATEFDSFLTSETDAAHYVITGQKGSDENFICEATVVTDGSGVFVSQGPNVSTKSTDMLQISATISAGVVSVKASSTSGASTVQAYAVKLKAPVDNTFTESVDTFAHATFRAAKYYLSCKSTNGEVMNVEALVTHNGSEAFITTFNEAFSGSGSLCEFNASIVGSNVVVSAAGFGTNLTVSGFRVILKDNESASTGDRVNIIGQTTISSTATAIDTFSDNTFTAAHYIVCATNSGESAASATEAIVISDGSAAFISQGPMLSTKSSDQVILTADHDGSNTVTLKAQSTSGSSTTVTAYRVALLRGPGTASQDAVIDTYDKTVFRSAKYNVSISDAINNRFEISEVNVTHNGSDAFVSTFGSVTNHTDPLVTFSADINGDNVRLIGTISNTTNHTVKAVKRVIQI